jgi:fructose-1,6-bisphosphatase
MNHGHSPISIKSCEEQIKNNSKVINIDAGCVYSNEQLGKLAAFEINSRTIFSILK